MDKSDCLDKILQAHEAYFDIERNHSFAGHVFDAFAEFHSESSQYVLVKRAKLWSATSHEYVFFKQMEAFGDDELHVFEEFVTGSALDKVRPDANHMSSLVVLVAIADEVADSAAQSVRRLKHRKNFALGIRGWADSGIVVLDMANCRIIASKSVKDMGGVFAAQLGWGG